ncbi:MAG: response regulator [Gemmatimonadetes bacterium]|nr:response regulator [Gemmatimonadota bacterium]
MTSGRLRVLLIEDSEEDALLVLRELRAGGYEPVVRRVETLSEARQALETEDRDVVLSDYELPAFGASEALAVVREHDSDVPFIIISEPIGEEAAVTALQAGADDLVVRGNLARLVPALERALRAGASRREQREETRALSERDELLRALLDASPTAIVMVDHEGRPRIRNRAANALLGSPEDGSARDAPELPAFRRIIERALNGESIHNQRLGREVDSGAIELEVSAAPIRAPSSAVAGAVVIAIDVSHRPELEEQRRQAQKMETVGRLAGGVAHDFNNILTAISGYADFLLDDLPEEGTLRSDAAEIRLAADRGTTLTRQLLALSRKQVVDPEHLDLGEVIVGVERMLRRIVGEDLAFEVDVAPDLPVYADRGQLEQVLMNLVLNARDAMPGGGTVSIRGARVQDPFGGDGAWVLLEVADTGSGMPPAVLDRVLEPFFTTKEAGRGTGLGLSIVHGIVAEAGGRIRVESDLGKGTRVRIYLPLGEGPHGSGAAPSASAEGGAGRSATILVVEDDEAIRTVTARALRNAGFTVLEAQDGEAALRRADEAGGAVDLVLLDVIMPRGNGPGTARALREKHGITRTLFMSGYSDDALARQLDAEVRRNLIAKPFGQRELIARIDEVLTGSTANHAEDSLGGTE